MHTCFVVSQFIPPRCRSRFGAPNLAYHLASRLTKELKVTVLTNLFPKGFVTNLGGIDVYSVAEKLPYYGGIKADTCAAFEAMKEVPYVLELLKHLDPDIVHVYGDITASLLASTCKLSRKPVVMTLTSPFSTNSFFNYDRYLHRPTRTLSSIALGAIDIVISMNRYMAEHLSTCFSLDQSKIRIVPHGISDRFLHTNSDGEARSSIDALKGANMILFWGEGTFNRGFHVFMKSIPQILKENPNVSFFIVVRHLDRRCLDLMMKIRNRAGFVLMNESKSSYNWPVEDIVASSSVVALPFLINPMEPPGTLVESLCAGRAVVTTDVGGNKETMENMVSGVLIKRGDSKELAEHCTRLIQDESFRKEMGAKARKLVLKKYQWDTCVQNIVRIYEEVLTR